jgi:hypothetical protein
MNDRRSSGLSAAADVYKGTEVIGFSIGDACGTRYSLSIYIFFVGLQIKLALTHTKTGPTEEKN